MREYLAATGLRATADEARARENAWQQSAISFAGDRMRTVASRAGAANPDRAAAQSRRVGSALSEIQINLYVQCYLSAHERWLEKMEQLEREAGDARRYFNALSRLNAIAALGTARRCAFWVRLADVSARVVRCELRDAIVPETIPRCSSCGFQSGASSPQAELEDLMEAIRRALELKLAALSQSMIARLIRNHDKRASTGRISENHASRADRRARASPRRELARYLAKVLEEIGR